MAISVAYGLAFGTLLTLIMLPALLMTVNRIKRSITWLLKRRMPSPEEVEPAIREDRFTEEQSGPCEEG